MTSLPLHSRPPPVVTDLDGDGNEDMLLLTNDNRLKHFTFPSIAKAYKPQEKVKTIGDVVSMFVYTSNYMFVICIS